MIPRSIPPHARGPLLYGVTHSPWVEGVRQALHYHRVQPRVTSYPLDLSWAISRGLIFPALRLSDGQTLLDSFTIYQALDDAGYPLGFAHISPAERDEAQLDLERLFLNYAPGRCVSGRRWRFIVAWSQMRELPFSARGVVSRAFVSLYFWILIRLGIALSHRRGRPVYDLDTIESQLHAWDDRLRTARWLTGETPGFLDFALLGHLQCMTSGLTEELLPCIRRQRHLMSWLEQLLTQLPADEPLYVHRLLDETLVSPRASAGEQTLFWLAWLGWLVVWPLTGTLVLALLLRRPRNPAHSGAVASRARRRSEGVPTGS